MSAKDRLHEYLKFKEINKPSFYYNTGLSNGFLDKRGGINSDKLTIISLSYTDLNLHWVITGNGNMISREQTPGIESVETSTSPTPDNSTEHQAHYSELTYTEYERLLNSKDETIVALNEAIRAYQQLVLLKG